MGQNLNQKSKTDAAPRYAAFISYAHTDEKEAARLHRMLESYRPPHPHKDARPRLRPVFRDKAELTASHSLSDEIKAAVKGSRKLLVLCSPAAKNSHWVNEEIRLFRALHGEDAILCALVEGTPQTSFPPALLEGGREPLAADLSGGPEGFRYGMLQIAASLLGVGLDDLVRRDARRRRRVGSFIVAGALLFSGAMGASTLAAMKARAEADANRADAENLVEYMITDLKTKLDAVGKLDILDGVGDKVMDYYSGQDLAEMPDDRIARQARAQHILGEVALNAGRYEDAKTQLDSAYALTKEVLNRNPEDTDAIFAHAQSAFWVGRVFKDQGKLEKTEPYWQEYHDLAYVLYNKDPNNFDWIMEAGWGEMNMGILSDSVSNFIQAESRYERGIMHFTSASGINPKSSIVTQALIQSYVGAEQSALKSGNIGKAMNMKKKGIKEAKALYNIDSKNNSALFDVARMQSNLLWQYFPLIKIDDRQVLINQPIKTLKKLSEYDTANKVWARQYIWHLILSSRYATTKEVRNRAFDSLKEQTAISSHSALSCYIDELEIFQAIENQNFPLAKKKVAALESKISTHFKGDLFGKIILMRTYSRLSDNENARVAAELVSKKLQATNSNLPEYSLAHAQAEVILGNCELAASILEPLRNAAVTDSPEIKKVISCKT